MANNLCLNPQIHGSPQRIIVQWRQTPEEAQQTRRSAYKNWLGQLFIVPPSMLSMAT